MFIIFCCYPTHHVHGKTFPEQLIFPAIIVTLIGNQCTIINFMARYKPNFLRFIYCKSFSICLLKFIFYAANIRIILETKKPIGFYRTDRLSVSCVLLVISQCKAVLPWHRQRCFSASTGGCTCDSVYSLPLVHPAV